MLAWHLLQSMSRAIRTTTPRPRKASSRDTHLRAFLMVKRERSVSSSRESPSCTRSRRSRTPNTMAPTSRCPRTSDAGHACHNLPIFVPEIPFCSPSGKKPAHIRPTLYHSLTAWRASTTFPYVQVSDGLWTNSPGTTLLQDVSRHSMGCQT